MQTQVEERQLEPTVVVSPPKRSRLLWAIVLLLTLATVVIVVAREWPFTERAVIVSLQQQVGTGVQIASFREFYFPHPGCVAEGVTFRKNQSAPALLTIQRLTIVGSYHGVLTHHLDEIRADGFHLIVQKEAAPNSLESLGKIYGELSIGKIVADGADVTFPAKQAGQQPLVFRIPKLVVHDLAGTEPLKFKATLQLPKPSAEVRLAGTFGPWRDAQPGQTRMSGSYAVRDLDLDEFGGVAGKIAASGKFDGELENVKVQGSLDVPDLEVRQSKHRIHLAALYEATVHGLNGDVDLDAVRVHFRHTTLVGAGSVSSQGTERGKTVNAEISGKNARIEDLLWMFVSENPPAMTGPIVFRAKVQVPPNKRAFIKKLQIEGDFGISNAQYPNPETQKNVDVLSARARGDADKIEDIDDKLGNDSYDPGRVLSNVKGHVVLRDGIAHLSNVSFDVPGAETVVSGTYSLLDERVNLSGHMHMVAELSKTTTGVKSFLLKAIQPFLHKSKKKESVVAIKIGGTYDHPTYGVVPRAEK